MFLAAEKKHLETADADPMSKNKEQISSDIHPGVAAVIIVRVYYHNNSLFWFDSIVHFLSLRWCRMQRST